MGRIVGIDFGTTYSAVACVNALGKPEVIRNREGQNITPSVVLFQGDAPIVGVMAKRSAATAPLDVVEFVKRHMGDPHWRFESSEGAVYTPEAIAALILKRIVEDASLALGEAITDAAITVPAYFDDARRRATMDAGTIAGLTVHRVLNEPTAAALAYGLDSRVGGSMLVYDLGGGTFDVTVMRVVDGAFDVLATDGDRNLGGFDWDNALMDWLNSEFQAAGGPDLTADDYTEADLRERAENAKLSLTTVGSTKVAISAGGVAHTITVTRERFESLTAHLLERTRDLTLNTLEDAGLGWEGVDKILLVGGSTRMPMVKALVEGLSRRQAERSLNPDEVVALGAAIQALMVEADTPDRRDDLPDVFAGSTPFVIKDVTSHGLGVLVRDQDNPTRMLNSIIIPRNSKVPTKNSDVYATVSDGQTEIVVQVTQGDDEEPDYVTIVGAQTLAIPPYPQGAPIQVTFAYDIDQVIQIEVVDLTAGRSLGAFEVVNDLNMGRDDVDSARERIEHMEVG